MQKLVFVFVALFIVAAFACRFHSNNGGGHSKRDGGGHGNNNGGGNGNNNGGGNGNNNGGGNGNNNNGGNNNNNGGNNNNHGNNGNHNDENCVCARRVYREDLDLVAAEQPGVCCAINGKDRDDVPQARYDLWSLWMRYALDIILQPPPLGQGPCAFGPYGAVAIDESIPFDPSLPLKEQPQLICEATGLSLTTRDELQHGEIQVHNCITNKYGHLFTTRPIKRAFFQKLTLLTTAEPCSMCQQTLNWDRMRNIVYATSLKTLREKGFPMAMARSIDVNCESTSLMRLTSPLNPNPSFDPQLYTSMYFNVGNEFTDDHFNYQFNTTGACPTGCARPSAGASCVPV